MDTPRYGRRELAILLPLLAATRASGQSSSLGTTMVRPGDTQMRKGDQMSSRPILKGLTHADIQLDLHETQLNSGEAPHAPHSHLHEELVILTSGTLDVTTGGKTTRLGAGSVAYMASNELHGWRNPGPAPAQYFVLAVGVDT